MSYGLSNYPICITRSPVLSAWTARMLGPTLLVLVVNNSGRPTSGCKRVLFQVYPQRNYIPVETISSQPSEGFWASSHTVLSHPEATGEVEDVFGDWPADFPIKAPSLVCPSTFWEFRKCHHRSLGLSKWTVLFVQRLRGCVIICNLPSPFARGSPLLAPSHQGAGKKL